MASITDKPASSSGDEQSTSSVKTEDSSAPDQPEQTHESQQQPGKHASQQTQACEDTSVSREDLLECKWMKCSETYTNPEHLYDHICDRHVGRKSTNNLTLTCQWESCRTTTVKRDHITSHIRVHVPLKPHKCDFCSKTFKRPQDLKKHVKTHADDSVLAARGSDNGQIGAGLSLRHQMPPKPPGPSGYYDPNDHLRSASAFAPSQSHAAYYATTPASTSYQMYFGQPQHMSMNINHHHHQQHQHAGSSQQPHAPYHHMAATPPPGSYDRKRTLDMVDDFLGSAKRRQVDSMSYAHISRSLLPLHGTVLNSTGAGHGPGPSQMHAEYMPQPSHQMHVAPMPAQQPQHQHQHQHQHQQHQQHQQHHHNQHQHPHDSLPQPVGPSPLAQHHVLPNARSHKDLLELNQILEQMRSTVYETVHSAHGPHHHEVSPSSTAIAVSTPDHYAAVPAAHLPSPQTSISSTGTPAVSPPTSTMSYTSGHSPTPSASTLSPQSRHSTATAAAAAAAAAAATAVAPMAMYPHVSTTAPGTSVFSGPGLGQSPPATLGATFDPGRRFPGGMLQSSRVSLRLHPTNANAKVKVEAVGDDATNPSTSDTKETTTTMTTTNSASSPTTPVSSPSSEPDTSEATRESEENYERMVETMRIVEALREYVQDRLRRQDYETEQDLARSQQQQQQQQQQQPQSPLYPALSVSLPTRTPEPKDVRIKVESTESPAPNPPVPLYPKLRL